MKLGILDTQADTSEGTLADQNIAYWKEQLRGVCLLQFPTDYPRADITEENRSLISFTIDEALTDDLLILTKQFQTTLFTTLLAGINVILHRYSTQNDISVAAVIPARGLEAAKDFFDHPDLLVLRSSVDSDASFSTFLHQLKTTIVEGASHPVLFDKILSAVNSGEPGNDIPLSQFVFALNSQSEIKAFKHHLSRSELTFALTSKDSYLEGSVEYNANLHSKQSVERIIEHFKQVLSSAVKDPEQKLGALPMLTTEEENLLVKFNDTITAYPEDKTIVDLFQEQALETPDHIALIQDDLNLTYRDLNEQANRLAAYITEQGVKEEDNVGLLAGRGFNMIIGMYAILKAGAAYVPVDPDYPTERQKYILRQSSVSWVIADDNYPLKDFINASEFININKVNLNTYGTENPGRTLRSRQLAYTIYTSGSTGLPKGVMIEHRSVVNLILWVNNEFKVGEKDRLLFITSMCFDLSVYDIFGMLAAGGSVVIAKQQEVIDVKRLKDLLISQKITFWDSVPTTLNYLVNELKSSGESYIQKNLRLVFLSGDWIPVHLPEEIKKYFPKAKVISLGGATEGTVWSNYFPVNKVEPQWTSIPYGRPIANNFFYVLNDQLQHVPPGITGELYIGGIGVARGYANDENKTNYSFKPDPFNDMAGGRMYRTGDLGRMMPDGNLEFLGRKDTQVKIRGYRVELGEIESVLNKCDLVSQAVVIAKENNGDKQLISYIVPHGKFDRKSIISYLKSKLPEYMVPSLWVELQKLPLTSNGKVDRKALPDVNISEHENSQYVPPQNEEQRKLALIWQEILGLEKIGIHDNFFELGGHSLMAVRMITRFEKDTGKKLPLSILFKYPTIHSLLSFIEKANMDTTWKSLVPIKASGTKAPVYIIHGSGLNVLNFSNIALHVDAGQPVFGLQAKGLDGIEEPLDDMKEIARSYIKEIIEHNPSGPYAIAGYSFGGYVAVEIRNQLELMGKKVKMLAIFDTNAVESDYYGKWHGKLFKKITRQFPKFLWILKSLITRPVTTLNYQATLLVKFFKSAAKKLIKSKEAESNDFYSRIDKINEKHWYAFRNYKLTPFNDTVYLFRAKDRVYYVNDFKYLGWQKYAKKGVKIYEVPGDHETMLLSPHAKDFAHALQHALDHC
jgi:amino acid adenylation domain-containing protein